MTQRSTSKNITKAIERYGVDEGYITEMWDGDINNNKSNQSENENENEDNNTASDDQDIDNNNISIKEESPEESYITINAMNMEEKLYDPETVEELPKAIITYRSTVLTNHGYNIMPIPTGTNNKYKLVLGAKK